MIKLLSVTNRYYLISISLFFIFAGVMLFYMIHHHLNEELNEELKAEKTQICKTMRSLDSLNSYSLVLNDNLTVKKINSSTRIQSTLFDSTIFDNNEMEYIPYRVIRFTSPTLKTNYIITIKKSQIESEDLAYSIFLSLIMIFGLFSIMLFIFNYYFSKKLWSPFLKTIRSIKTLNISNSETAFESSTTHIQEFNELNSSLLQMINRIKSDFNRMKEFSENAAHELHTPLSIIRTKLESLLQSKNLNNEDAQLINQALENTVRLSKINQTLLLLTKIENHQFEKKQIITISEVFRKFIELYDETIADKELKVNVKIEEEFICEMHPVLVDVLLSNLLSNAIKHNIQKGTLSIRFKKDEFEITNSGLSPEYPCELLFTRFKKGNHHSSEHLGLGLALVKEIVDTNNLQVFYTFDNGLHSVRIKK